MMMHSDEEPYDVELQEIMESRARGGPGLTRDEEAKLREQHWRSQAYIDQSYHATEDELRAEQQELEFWQRNNRNASSGLDTSLHEIIEARAQRGPVMTRDEAVKLQENRRREESACTRRQSSRSPQPEMPREDEDDCPKTTRQKCVIDEERIRHQLASRGGAVCFQ